MTEVIIKKLNHKYEIRELCIKELVKLEKTIVRKLEKVNALYQETKEL